MCVVSMILDHGKDRWPLPDLTIPEPIINPPDQLPTPEELKEFKELLEKARKWDELVGEPDCELEEKMDWLRELEKRVEALEKKRIIHGPTEEVTIDEAKERDWS